MRWRGWRREPGELARDHRDLGPRSVFSVAVTGSVGVDDQPRDVDVPEHGEVRLDQLVLGREVQPDLEELGRIGRVAVEERERLRVDDAAAGGEPLDVAAPEPRRRAQRIGVVDHAPAHVGDGLEPAVRMLGEARHVAAVVHPPAVDAGEVLAEVTPVERRRGAEVDVAGGILVDVVYAEQERIGRGPHEFQRERLQHGTGHGPRVGRGSRRNIARAPRVRSAFFARSRCGLARVPWRPTWQS